MKARPAHLSPADRGQALSELERISGTLDAMAAWLDDAEPRTAALLHDAASTTMTASWALVRGRLGTTERHRIDAMSGDGYGG